MTDIEIKTLAPSMWSASLNQSNRLWSSVFESLNEKGFALIPKILSAHECNHTKSFYDDPILFRNVINMQRYRFGAGEYKYFQYPLPPLLQVLRQAFYKQLFPLANSWMNALNISRTFPGEHNKFIEQCHQHGQQRCTPLILRYEKGGFNTLHQDLYGEMYFPFQVVIVLSERNDEYEGGEFVMTEQIPRAQSRAHVVIPNQGDALIFTTNFRPVKSTRGYYRATMKHGVSEVKSGVRYSLGIIFHDAS